MKSINCKSVKFLNSLVFRFSLYASLLYAILSIIIYTKLGTLRSIRKIFRGKIKQEQAFLYTCNAKNEYDEKIKKAGFPRPF